MEYNVLGHSGLKVSEIIFGNWVPDRDTGDEAKTTACIHAALEAGITTFDTADSYSNGWSEQIMGEALARERRDGLEIMTKVFFPTGSGVNDRGLSRKHILTSIDSSLRRLKTDYVDLYQAHRFDYETPLEETMIAFADVVRAGKAMYIGVSWWTAEQIREGAALAAQLNIHLVANQSQYSMLFRSIEPTVLPASIDCGVDQLAWSPLAQGVLSGKYTSANRTPAGSRALDRAGHGTYMDLWMNDATLDAIQELTPIARDIGLTISQLSLAWVLSTPGVAAAVIGASRPSQVVENAVAGGRRLTSDVLSAIEAVVRDFVTRDESLVASDRIRP